MFRRATVGMGGCYRTHPAWVHPWSKTSALDYLVIACEDPDVAAATLEREVGLRAAGGGPP